MTIQEAAKSMYDLQKENIHVWARPISWVGSGMAVAIEFAEKWSTDTGVKQKLTIVPKGGYKQIVPNFSIEDLTSSWEVCDPQKVLGEDE